MAFFKHLVFDLLVELESHRLPFMKAGNEKSSNLSGWISHSRFPYRGFINAGQSASLG